MLVSITATNAQSAWAAGTYAKGAEVLRQVVATRGHMRGLPMLRVFESLEDGNTGTPGVDSDKWLDVGPANTVAMFDDRISTETQQAGSDDLVVRLAPGKTVTTVAMFGVKASRVRVQVFDDDVQTFDQTQELLPDNVADWFQYFTAPVDQLASRLLFSGLPCYFYSQILITFEGTDIAVGAVTFGESIELGTSPLLGAEIGMDDYSVKETNEYGETLFEERDSADYQNLTVLVDKVRLNAVSVLLRRLKSMPTVLIGSDDPDYAESLINLGWIGSHRLVLAYPNHALLDIDFKGLI